jgi:hypothetical protein
MIFDRLTPFAFALLPTLAACDETPTAIEAPVATSEPAGPGVPIDHPPVELAPSSRLPQRLTVSMLAHSLPIVAGDDADGQPIRWTIPRGNGRQVDALSPDGLARTLGHPDYIQITEEPAEPTPLYAKFMDDMARDVCTKMVRADAAIGATGERTLTRSAPLDGEVEASALRRNLRYLMLRFHAHKVDDDDVAGVADLQELFETAAAGGQTRAGWAAVCVALFESPSFHIY